MYKSFTKEFELTSIERNGWKCSFNCIKSFSIELNFTILCHVSIKNSYTELHKRICVHCCLYMVIARKVFLVICFQASVHYIVCIKMYRSCTRFHKRTGIHYLLWQVLQKMCFDLCYVFIKLLLRCLLDSVKRWNCNILTILKKVL